MKVSNKVVRLSSVEYEDTHDLIGAAATAINTRKEVVRELFRSAGERVSRILRLGSNPITLSANAVNIGGIAGLLRIAPRLELEIIPKFLNKNNPRWREEFFYLSMLSHHGSLLASERLSSSSGNRDDLATLVSRAIVGMFWENHRRPLRTYRRARLNDFAIDGEVDPETLVIPNSEGYEQEIICYDRKNAYNATILAAVQVLLTEVRDPQTRQQLSRVSSVLSPQRRLVRLVTNNVPNRSKRWQSLFDLASDVVKGFGVSFNSASVKSPGFVLDTWRVWEDVLTLGLRLGLGATAVQPQRAHQLGSRDIRNDPANLSRKRALYVYPDISILHDKTLSFLLDAKYKTRLKDSRTRIAEADVYEALAFAKASGCDHVLLGYPQRGDLNKSGGPGTSRVFERVVIGDVSIVGIEIELQGISHLGGLREFAKNLTKDVLSNKE